MLSRAHRITDAGHFRQVQRRGFRVGTPYFVSVTQVTASDQPSRFGFVVSKQVGGAVVRNRVKRRLRSLAAEALALAPYGVDVVTRALPLAAGADFGELEKSWQKVVHSWSTR